MQQLINQFMAILPGAKNDVMPLFRTKEGLRPSFEWSSRDYSQIDWDEPYCDFNPSTKEKYYRDIAGFAVRGGAYVIIDIDNKPGGVPAEENYQKLIAMGFNGSSFMVKTKSGGYHLYYQAPDYDVKTMTGFIPGVDIRGAGGYVVGPNPGLTTWTPGQYTILNRELKPQPLTVELPRKGSQPAVNLPSLDDMQLLTSDYDRYMAMPIIPNGKRDQALLAISGKWYSLADQEIASKFEQLNFETVPGDEITLAHLMAKIARDRAKNSQTALELADYLLARFIYIVDSDKMYDRVRGLAIRMSTAQNYWPATITIPNGDKVKHIPQVQYWLSSPDRLTADTVGFKPSEEIIFEVNGRTYLNTYQPVKINPWHDPVTWDDPMLKEFRQVAELITNHNPEVLDLYLSQRAAKIQNLTWTPAWGFVLISKHQQVGKDFIAHIYSQLLGARYVRTITKAELVDPRKEYNHEKLMVILNEPGGLQRGAKGLETIEILKEFMSSKKGSAKMLYQNQGDEAPLYKVPEIHSNLVDSFEMTESHARFAPILITGMPLPIEVYQALGAKLDDDNVAGCVFYRKLKRFFLDYKVSPKIIEARPPVMPDHSTAMVASKGDEHKDLIDAIEGRVGLFYSDVQTKPTLVLALELTVCNGNRTAAMRLANKLCKENKLVRSMGPGETNRVPDLPLIEYDKNNICSDRARITRLPAGYHTTPTVFVIRDYERYENKKSKFFKDNFFPE